MEVDDLELVDILREMSDSELRELSDMIEAEVRRRVYRETFRIVVYKAGLGLYGD